MFITTDMTTHTISSAFDNETRVMFIPSHDHLTSTMGNRTDLLSASTDGSYSHYVAHDATIIYGNESKDNPGYFVSVTPDEAEEITTALAQGDIRFALRKSND